MLLDAPITIYGSPKDNVGLPCTFADFLRLCKRAKKTIANLRATAQEEERKRLKNALPCATISGQFAPTRATANLKTHSGLICLDIDHVADTAALLELIGQMNIVAYCSRSASGHGVFAVVPLAYPDRHTAQFEALRRYFAGMGVELDGQCKDVTRLRFVSYDEGAMIRPDAEPYRGLWQEQRKPSKPRSIKSYDPGSALEAVAQCCRAIAAAHVDITNGYRNWFEIGSALASLGEEGREFYHVVSSQSPQYKAAECDRKFTNLLKTTHGYTIATFFKACKDNGVTYNLQPQRPTAQEDFAHLDISDL